MGFRTCGLNFVLIGLAMIVADLAAAQSEAEFYQGKTVTVLLPTTAGGDATANTIPFVGHFGKHIPGKPNVIISYMPGAGGAAGINHLYNVAPRDGTWIGKPLTTLVISQVTGDDSVKYDVSKMNWLGRTAANNQVIYAWHTTGVSAIDGAKRKQLTIGSTGVNSASTILPLILNETLGTRFKIIQGYKGSAAFNLAVERGETDASLTTWNHIRTHFMAWIKDGRARILVQLALKRHPELPAIPTAAELAASDGDRALIEFASSSAELGQSYITPPGLPMVRVDTLRRAFEATMKDADYLAAVAKARIELDPMTGDEVTKMVGRVLSSPKPVVERYKASVVVDEARKGAAR